MKISQLRKKAAGLYHAARAHTGNIMTGSLMAIVPMQDVPTIAIDADTVQTGLFTGANMIIGALGSIMFLLIGFQFGGNILRAIGGYVSGWRF